MGYRIEGNNFYITRGDTATIPLEFLAEAEVGEEALDITGATIYFTVKKDVSNTYDKAVIKKVISVHTAPTDGLSEIVLTSADTDIFEAKYIYDIKIEFANGDIDTLVFDGVVQNGFLYIEINKGFKK